jgi:hypothetical protein
MGLKLRGVIRCGRCGKPRGVTHTCVTSATSKRRVRRHRVQSPVTWECAECGKRRGLQHTCGNRGDFKKRTRTHATGRRRSARKKAAAAARQKRRERDARIRADVRQRERAKKSAGKTKPRSSRPRGDSHEPGTCGDRDCPRFGCKSYWAGMADCPGPHGAE